MSKVEEVARAIMVGGGCGAMLEGERVFCDDARLIQTADCNCREMARAAIAAMREPSEAMVKAVFAIEQVDIVSEYHAMIDAALQE